MYGLKVGSDFIPSETNSTSSTSAKQTPAVVSGYVWRFAKKEGAAIFYRGIRTWDKDGAEERSLHILNTFGPLVLGPTWPVPTMFLEGKPEYNHISSTLIRNMCQEGGQASLPSLVPGSIADSISKLYQ